jgi:hypothetical protein
LIILVDHPRALYAPAERRATFAWRTSWRIREHFDTLQSGLASQVTLAPHCAHRYLFVREADKSLSIKNSEVVQAAKISAGE